MRVRVSGGDDESVNYKPVGYWKAQHAPNLVCFNATEIHRNNNPPAQHDYR